MWLYLQTSSGVMIKKEIRGKIVYMKAILACRSFPTCFLVIFCCLYFLLSKIGVHGAKNNKHKRKY